MIWFRRSLAVFLGILFIILLPIALLVFRVNDTALHPDFYINELRQADVYNFAYNDLLPAIADENLEKVDELPLSVRLTKEDVVASVQRVAPPKWTQEQIEKTIREVLPYFTGREDHFEITVPLSDRVEAALQVVRDYLTRADVYDVLFDEVISPRVTDSLGQYASLPFGVTITSDEVVEELRKVVPREWVQLQVFNLIDQVGPYVVGKTDSFYFAVPLRDRVDAALASLEKLADRKLTTLFSRLPECTQNQLLRLVKAGVTNELPECRPPGWTLDQTKDNFSLDLSRQVRLAIGDRLPDTLTYTEQDLRYTLLNQGNADALDLLDKARDVIANGFTYSDADLREDLSNANNSEAFDGQNSEQALDQLRENAGRVKTYRYAAFIVLVLFLVAIGFLGGRGWASRAAWAASFLGIASAITFAITGPIYKLMGKPVLNAALDDNLVKSSNEGAARIAAEKGADIIKMLVSDFLSGMEGLSMKLFIVAIVVLALVVFWTWREGQLFKGGQKSSSSPGSKRSRRSKRAKTSE